MHTETFSSSQSLLMFHDGFVREMYALTVGDRSCQKAKQEDWPQDGGSWSAVPWGSARRQLALQHGWPSLCNQHPKGCGEPRAAERRVVRRKRVCQRSKGAPEPAGTNSPASALVTLEQAGTKPAAAGDGGSREARLKTGCPRSRRKQESPFGIGFCHKQKYQNMFLYGSDPHPEGLPMQCSLTCEQKPRARAIGEKKTTDGSKELSS